MKRSIFATACLVCLLAETGQSAVPASIIVQGRLMDSTGTPYPPGHRSLFFRIFNAQVGGGLVWGGEDHFLEIREGGLWSAQVGSINGLTDAVFADTVRWLDIAVDGTVLPRIRLVTGPYAHRVSTVDGASGGSIIGKVSIGPGHTNSGNHAFVAGNGNSVSGTSSMIGGGEQHFLGVGAAYGVIAGGYENTLTGQAGAVGGGQGNQVSSSFGVVSGGVTNSVSGNFAAIPGGSANDADGRFSLAAGRRAHANHAGDFVWADSTNADFASTAPNQFLIRAGGGVGIGTNAPEGELHVFAGSAGAVAASGSSIAVFEDDASSYISLLSPDNTERGILFGSPADATQGSIRFNVSTARKGMHFRTGDNLIRLVLDSLGNLTADGCVVGSNIACPSDARFKRNIETLPNALRTVESLRGVRYEWKTEEIAERTFTEGEQVGLIAQEVREVVPQAVVEQSDGYLAVDYSRLVPLLIEAIKEQQRQIDDLRATVKSMTP